MKLLPTFLVMAGFACVAVAAFLWFATAEAEGCTFPCTDSGLFQETLAPIIWVLIAITLWSIAGILNWMQRRFDRLSI